MKRTNKSEKTIRNCEEIISNFPECGILTLHAMQCIRGGDGEDNGGEPIIIVPKEP